MNKLGVADETADRSILSLWSWRSFGSWVPVFIRKWRCRSTTKTNVTSTTPPTTTAPIVDVGNVAEVSEEEGLVKGVVTDPTVVETLAKATSKAVWKFVLLRAAVNSTLWRSSTKTEKWTSLLAARRPTASDTESTNTRKSPMDCFFKKASTELTNLASFHSRLSMVTVLRM